MGEFQIINGDAIDILRQIPNDTIDSLVTDPPAGINFMGKTWDKPGILGISGGLAMPSTTSTRNPSCKNCGGRKRAGDKTKACVCEVPDWNDLDYRLADRNNFISFIELIARECLRVLKPGAHGVVWALPRTSHWTATALEQAGFEVRDVITHHFGTGFPKSLNVSKAIDSSGGPHAIRRMEMGDDYEPSGRGRLNYDHGGGSVMNGVVDATREPSDIAKIWNGWGTALKPATEHWILVRKSLTGTVAANVQEYGTGALNIDACRIGAGTLVPGGEPHIEGRWPANLVLSHSEWCEDGACLPNCPVKLLDGQSGQTLSTGGVNGGGLGNNILGRFANAKPSATAGGFGDKGGASRFFYIAKPSTAERDAGLAAFPKTGSRANVHPTVKSIALMSWLVRLISPPGGLVLDPFCGSGTTGMASLLGGWNFLGIEKDPEYAKIAEARISYVAGQTTGNAAA